MRIYRLCENSLSQITLSGDAIPENIDTIDDEPIKPNKLIEFEPNKWFYNVRKINSNYHLILCEKMPDIYSIEELAYMEFEKGLYSEIIDTPQFISLVKEYLYEFDCAKRIELLRKYAMEFNDEIKNSFIYKLKIHSSYNLSYIKGNEIFSLIENVFNRASIIDYCDDIDFESLAFIKGLYNCIMMYNLIHVITY